MQAAKAGDADHAGRLCHAFAAYCSSSVLLWASQSPEVGGLQAMLCTLGNGAPQASGEPVAASALVAWAHVGEFLAHQRSSQSAAELSLDNR